MVVSITDHLWMALVELTIIDLLKSYLSVLRQTLLGFTAQHEGLWFLRRSHSRMMLGVHHVRHSTDSKGPIDQQSENNRVDRC